MGGIDLKCTTLVCPSDSDSPLVTERVSEVTQSL